jgi:Flp pilus assembly protein TadD
VPVGIFVSRQFRQTPRAEPAAPSLISTQAVAGTRPELTQPLPADSHLSGTNLQGVVETRQKESSSVELSSFAGSMLVQGNPKAAIQAYKQALDLTPNDEDLHYNLGIAYNQTGDLTNAEKEYREALRLLPDYPEVQNNLGNLLMREGRLAEAEEYFLGALKSMPEYAQAHNNLGTLRQKQGRTDEALASFQKAVAYDTNHWQAHFNLGTAYMAKGQREEAARELRETLRLNPDFAPAERALAKALGQTLPETDPAGKGL